MTTEQINELTKAAMKGTIEDCVNPIFLFSTTSNALLTQIAKGEIDAKLLAEFELLSRGIKADYISKEAIELFNSTRK